MQVKEGCQKMPSEGGQAGRDMGNAGGEAGPSC